MRANLAQLQEIYSERVPYEIEQKSDNSELIIFSLVFTDLFEIALESGCVTKMSEEELTLFYDFVNYEDGLYDDVYVQALDGWIMNVMNGVENPIIEGCK